MCLIRTLQLFLLLQDYATQQAEEEDQVLTATELATQAQERAALLEQKISHHMISHQMDSSSPTVTSWPNTSVSHRFIIGKTQFLTQEDVVAAFFFPHRATKLNIGW